MNFTSYDSQIRKLQNQITLLRSEIDKLKNRSDDVLWDSSDLIRNWKISQRKLASLRAEGLIDYVQLGRKIWYTRENREAFLQRNTVEGKME